jgi:hypothetical protein
LLSDDNPACVDASIYRFLYSLFLQRAKLVEPTGPGKETMVSYPVISYYIILSISSMATSLRA